MAASLSRPDPSSPASVAEAAFTTARRGFSTDEVRAFLVAVAAEMGRLQERERQLEAELRSVRDEARSIELDDEMVTKMLGEETLRVLHTARESASEIKIRAEENAARILREAHDEANRVRQDTEVDVARRRQDANADAEAEVALAKQQGREMVNEARAYRERVLADLERRTTLARQQIEELIHGRDRLLQVFERARLVAVDVTSELRAIDEPDELVNLTPTTGPVPLMVPNQRREPATEQPGPTESLDQAEQADAPTDREPPATVEGDHGDETVDDDGALGTAEDTVVDETDEADEADGTADTADTAETDDTDGAAEEPDDAADTDGDTAETDDTVESRDDEAPGHDTNVVSLFRGRTSPSESAIADDHPSTDGERAEHGDDADDRPDVGGIFERLRQETTDTDDSVVDQPEAGDAEAATETEPVVATDAVDPAAELPDAEQPDAEDDVEEPTPFSRRDEALVPLIVSGARRIKRVLADEQNEALDMLRQGDAVTSLDALVPLVDEHVALYVTALTEDLTAAAAAGAAEAGVKVTRALRTKLVKAGAIDAATDQVRSELVTPLRDRLARAVGDGDGNNDDITKRVRAVYREWKTQHIDDQLDDVFRRAFSGGLFATVEPGTPTIWTVDPTTAACPDCEDNSLAGSVAAGDPFPTGHTTAPGHPGCRCLTLPAG